MLFVLVKSQISDGNMEKEIGDDFIKFCSKDDLDVELNSKQLVKVFKEGYLTNLVRSGFLTSEVTGMCSVIQRTNLIKYANKF